MQSRKSHGGYPPGRARQRALELLRRSQPGQTVLFSASILFSTQSVCREPSLSVGRKRSTQNTIRFSITAIPSIVIMYLYSVDYKCQPLSPAFVCVRVCRDRYTLLAHNGNFPC